MRVAEWVRRSQFWEQWEQNHPLSGVNDTRIHCCTHLFPFTHSILGTREPLNHAGCSAVFPLFPVFPLFFRFL